MVKAMDSREFNNIPGLRCSISQNHDVFFVDTAKDMCEFTWMALNGQANEYLDKHPVASELLIIA